MAKQTASEAPRARKTRSSVVPENETKEERFVRLVNLRVPKVIAALKGVAHLASKANYEYSDEQLAKVFERMEKEMATTVMAFSNGSGAHKESIL